MLDKPICMFIYLLIYQYQHVHVSMLNYLSTLVVSLCISMCVQEHNSKARLHLCLFFVSYILICLDNECISANCYSYYVKYQSELGKCLLLKFVQTVAILLQDTLSVRYTNWILSALLIISCSNKVIQKWRIWQIWSKGCLSVGI